MEAKAAVALAGLLEAAGAAAAWLAASRLWRASSAVGDKSLRLAAAGLILYSMGLLVEALGVLSFHARHPPRGARPEEVAVLLVNRGTLLAMPVYTAAYTLLAASVYMGHVPVDSREGRALAAAPVIVGVYANYNLLSLAALAAAAYYTLAGYGKPSPANTAFYTLAAASHATAALAALTPHWQLIAASMALRGAAILAFHILAAGRRG